MMLYVPEGFAHGFLVLSSLAEFEYKLSDFYHPEDESGIPWDDPDIGIDWPISSDMKVLVNQRDANHPRFSSGIVLKKKIKKH